MPRFQTAVAKNGTTHVCDTRSAKTLCGKWNHDLTVAEYDDDEATCKTCKKRDPRNQNGPNDGPRVLKHLLQF